VQRATESFIDPTILLDGQGLPFRFTLARVSQPDIEVLLATYNGARFLREQVDSLLDQDYEHLRILARDDGSSDSSAAILATYADRFPDQVRVLPTVTPSGSAPKNFLLLMQSSTADYACFSDQDDVWLPDKVSRSKEIMDQLEARWGREMPLLVFSDLRVVDEKLETLDPSFWRVMGVDPDRIQRLPELLLESVVTGCTAMVNRPLLDLAVRMAPQASMHDRWIGLIAGFLGKAGILQAQTVIYRQHDDNLLGTGRRQVTTAAEPSKQRLDNANLRAWNSSQRDAEAFLTTYQKELPAEQQALLKRFLRCQSSRSAFLRVITFLSGFRYAQIRHNLAMAAYLWAKNADDGHDEQ
jgi:glycosyltransferase involved in cell wall biosynthesis